MDIETLEISYKTYQEIVKLKDLIETVEKGKINGQIQYRGGNNYRYINILGKDREEIIEAQLKRLILLEAKTQLRKLEKKFKDIKT